MNRAEQSSALRGLEVLSDSHYIEYRYYANRSRAEQHNYPHRYGWLDSLAVGLFSFLSYQSLDSRWHLFGTIGMLLLYMYWRCSRIIYESVIVIPPHGLQLETHRGPFKSLFVSRRFIPSVYIQDIIINEALHRWNIRYYLAVIVDTPGENIEIAVAFENTLPHFPVLLEVYHGVKKALYKG